ncbi:MAG TPA: oxidoreductase [Anaeromyxobacteraceae bacterium]|nr:oxidoreductase [Anaeromyxobacteraceae bacterium]
MTEHPAPSLQAGASTAGAPAAAPGSGPAPVPAPARNGPAAAPRRKIKELEAMVADVVVETHDTVTLVFFTGNERLEYEPGHFLTIDPHQFEGLERWTAYLEDQKGKREPPRAYSMCSAPLEKYVAVTVKEERYVRGSTKYPPLLSPMLVKRTPRGQRLHFIGFTGPYVLPADVTSRTDHLVHLVAGSGSVPNFSILKHALALLPSIRHTFVYSNKTWGDIIFRQQLEELRRRHPDQLRVVHTLTREENPQRYGPDVRQGRVSPALLRELIPDPAACLVYACGPAIGPYERAAAKEKGETPQPRFLEAALAALKEADVPPDRIKTESYG